MASERIYRQHPVLERPRVEAVKMSSTLKKVLNIHRETDTHWVGDGFHVRTVFSYEDPEMSPFLLLDYATPAEFPPSTKRRGVGEHPHRGFETVTIVYQGELEHRDSGGGGGKIGSGDVQWMTAGSGLVHEEFHSQEFTRKGGVVEMAQLWVNLPAKFKKTPPRYQTILDGDIPVVSLAGDAGTVRVIAGEFQGRKGPATTFTPMNVWDLRLKAGHRAEFNLPEGSTTALLLRNGEVIVNGTKAAGEASLVLFNRAGEVVVIESKKDAAMILLNGAPIDEPVVGYGPFVMNTKEEIRQAIEDYNSGRMGHLS